MSHYEINSPNAVGEVIDGEAIILNLKSGDYFSCLNVGAAIWRGIETGIGIDMLTHELHARFPDATASIDEDVAGFIARLLEHQLIRPSAGLGTASPGEDPLLGVERYSKPELQAYSDMKSLLLLDPVHDVGEEGWPKAKG